MHAGFEQLNFPSALYKFFGHSRSLVIGGLWVNFGAGLMIVMGVGMSTCGAGHYGLGPGDDVQLM